jgi:hypothetical protein
VVDDLLEAKGVDWQTTMRICRLCDIPACEHRAPCPATLTPQRDTPLPETATRSTTLTRP